MEGLALDAGADGPGATRHLDQFVVRFCHAAETIPGAGSNGEYRKRVGREPSLGGGVGIGIGIEGRWDSMPMAIPTPMGLGECWEIDSGS